MVSTLSTPNTTSRIVAPSGAEPGQRDRQGEDAATDGLGQGQGEGEPERRQRLEPVRQAGAPPPESLAERQRREAGRRDVHAGPLPVCLVDDRVVGAEGGPDTASLDGQTVLLDDPAQDLGPKRGIRRHQAGPMVGMAIEVLDGRPERQAAALGQGAQELALGFGRGPLGLEARHRPTRP